MPLNRMTEQIRPFGYLLVFMPRTGLFAAPDVRDVDGAIRGRPRKSSKLKPIAAK